MQDLRDIIQYHRKLAGLSRIRLAETAGVGKTVIFDIEHGKQTVRLETLLKVLEALNLRLAVAGPIVDQVKESSDA